MVFSFQCFVPPEEMKMSLEEETSLTLSFIQLLSNKLKADILLHGFG